MGVDEGEVDPPRLGALEYLGIEIADERCDARMVLPGLVEVEVEVAQQDKVRRNHSLLADQPVGHPLDERAKLGVALLLRAIEQMGVNGDESESLAVGAGNLESGYVRRAGKGDEGGKPKGRLPSAIAVLEPLHLLIEIAPSGDDRLLVLIEVLDHAGPIHGQIGGHLGPIDAASAVEVPEPLGHPGLTGDLTRDIGHDEAELAGAGHPLVDPVL